MNSRSDGCISYYIIREKFSTVAILDVRLCIVVGRASRVLSEDWKVVLVELVVFVMGGPRTPSSVEGKVKGFSTVVGKVCTKTGLRLGLGLSFFVGWILGLLTEIIVGGNVSYRKKRAEKAALRNHSEIEEQFFPVSSDPGVLPLSVAEAVWLFCGSRVDIGFEGEAMKEKEWEVQKEAERLLGPA